ncbi:MAG TPA: Ig-like domain-containing protein, partial [Vicinamibacterales bacterium]|nr:Ig-like domain-containing protein [Vicinamibacterales bacterium]
MPLRLRSGAPRSWFLTPLAIAILETLFLSLTVTASSFDFALANGGNRSVTPGASVSNPVTATRTSGSTRPVTFSASGLPPGAQATFSTSSCSPTCSTTVTISTAGSTPLTTSTITITATSGGRVRRTSFALTVTAGTDTAAPTVALSAPANNAFVAGTAVAVSATASDNAAVAGVQFLLDGANLGGEDTTAPYAVTWNTTAASNGPHVLSSRARDASGNTATAASVNVTVDNQAPAGSVAINDGAPSTNTTTVALTLGASDAVSTVTQMRFSNTGTSYSSPEAYGPSKTWTLSSGSGTKTVYAQFKDAAGNWSAAATDTIVLEAAPDTAPPSVVIASPADGATVAGTVTVSASAQDDVAVAGVQFQIDGANAGPEVNIAPFTTSVDTTTLPDGNHVLTAIARDTSNNTAMSAAVSVTVNNSAPSIPTFIQHVTTSSNYDPSELGNNFRVHLADPALANNCVILGIRYPDTPGRTVTVGDNRGNAWLAGPTVSNNG